MILLLLRIVWQMADVHLLFFFSHFSPIWLICLCLYIWQVNLNQNREHIQNKLAIQLFISLFIYWYKAKIHDMSTSKINITSIALENKDENKRWVMNKTCTILLTLWDLFPLGESPEIKSTSSIIVNECVYLPDT